MPLINSILSLNGYPIKRAIEQLAAIQSLSIDEFESWQTKKRWEIARFHFDNNEFYRSKIGQFFPDKWEDLPVMTKKDLQSRQLSQLLSNGFTSKNSYVANTSGSSGIPLQFAKDKFAHAMTWALIANRYSWHNVDINARQARFYGIPFGKGYYKEKLKDILFNRKRFSVFDLSDKRLGEFVKIFQNNKFRYIYGYSSALVLFAQYLSREQCVLSNICPTLKLCISTSEMLSPEDAALLSKVFGVKHIREYGASETCLIGFENIDGDWLLTSETLFNEVVDESYRAVKTGDEGRLLSTSLFNRALPLIRYDLGDNVILEKGNSDKYYNIKQLTGRVNDVILLPGGKKAAGLAMYYVLRGIIENSTSVREFVIRQTTIDTFVFYVVATKQLLDGETELIKTKTIEYLGCKVDVFIKEVENIERPASGKRKLFHSEILHSCE
jgi:phenylacetate-CoA ligase